MMNEKNSFSMEDVRRLSSTPAGQELLKLLSTGGQDVEKARQAAQKGDFHQARNALEDLLKSPKVQQLLKEMEKNYG